MGVLKFLILFLIGHLMLMQVFRLSTYHAYFWKSLPLLVALSALIGWLLFYLRLHEFFIWYIVLESVWLYMLARKQNTAMEAMLGMAGNDADLVRGMAVSTSKTKTYYALSSFIHIFGVSATYLYFYNR